MDLFNLKWYKTHLRTIRQLVEDKSFVEARPGELVLEVWMLDAVLTGPFPHVGNHQLKNLFVRQVVDDEDVGHTRVAHDYHISYGRYGAQQHHPVWNERMLVIARGAAINRFQVWMGSYSPVLLGECIFSTETLWHVATTCGRFDVKVPLLLNQLKVGSLHLRFQQWDGEPLTEVPGSVALDSFLEGRHQELAAVGHHDVAHDGIHGQFSSQPSPVTPPWGSPGAAHYDSHRPSVGQ